MSSRSATLTPGQIGLLLESDLAGKPALNVLQVLVRFTGETPDAARLQQAWTEVARRHDVLRLVVTPLSPQGALQTLRAETMLDFDQVALPDADALDLWLEADRRRGAPVDAVPNWRLRLVTLGAGSSLLVWTFHHALLDGGGYQLLLREAFALYDAALHGGVPSLPPAVSFLDHCDALAAVDHDPARAYFRTHLADFDQANRLAPVFLAPEGSGADPQIRRHLCDGLNADAAEALRRAARSAGVSTATMIFAAWGLVLARCSGRDEAVFGVTRSGRFLLENAQTCAGCQINTLPCRVSLKGATLGDLLAQVHNHSQAMRAFELTPLSEVASVCDLPGGTALFDSIVVFDRQSVDALMQAEGPHWSNRTAEERSQIATPLTLSVHDDPRMALRLEYDPAAISSEGAKRLLTYLRNVLAAMTGDSARSLALLDMLPAEETAQLLDLARADQGTDPGAADAALLVAIETIAQQDPDRPALVQIGQPDTLGFGALNRRANHLAWQLRQDGVQPGDIVGLALPRGADYVAALLAVWKVQAAFLPLDPDYPAEALQDMIARASARLVLTHADTHARLAASPTPLRVVEGDAMRDEAPPRGAHDPQSRAYVLYTSGSTGRPKAVVIAHRAISHHAAAIRQAFALTPADRVLQFASLNFDVSLEEILPSLAAGACVVLRDDSAKASLSQFLQGLAEAGVTVLNLPTAFWTLLAAHLAETPGSLLPPSVRLVIAGGERVSASALALWLDRCPGQRWLNGYGPTETTITATLFDPIAAGHDGGEVPIGRPLDHCRAYVLAADGSLAPLGVTGELAIGGNGVALGYLDPAQTARVFVEDAQGARLYRSGDLASWRPDRQLAYHGRADRQVKLRGFRLELQALESVLEADPRIAAAVVSLERASSAQAHLLGWVHLRSTADAPPPEALTALLAGHLPPGVKVRVLVVEDMPQTRGGKIDMARLPRPALTDEVTPEAPADPTTARLQAIFAEILDFGPVGPDQSFFDLGGHSLLSIRLMGLIERDFGPRLSLAALYRAPTPRALAAEVLVAALADVPDCLMPIQPLGDAPPIYAVQIVGPGGSFFQPLARHLGVDQPLFGLTMDLLEPNAPRTVEAIADIYRANIQAHRPTGPVRLVAVSQASFIAFELARQLLEAGRDVQMLALLDAAGPGGRAQKVLTKPVGHYVRQLRRNLPGILRGKVTRVIEEAQFQIERIRFRLLHKVPPLGGEASFSVYLHQAAIDVAINQYRAQPYPREITVFRSLEAEGDAPAALESGLGWSIVAPAGVRLIEVPGDHLGMLGEPHVAEIARHLRSDMD